MIGNQSFAGMVAEGKAGEGELTLLLPAGFDVDSLPGNGERPARVAYVAHLITTRPMNKKGFVSLNKKLLQSLISLKAEKAAFSFLESLIEVDHSYTPGLASKGYRWRDDAQVGGAVLHKFHAPRLKKKLEDRNDQVRSSYSNLEMNLEADMKLIDLPVPNLAEIVDAIPPKRGVVSESHRKRVILASGMMIQRGNMGVIRSSANTGRVHCSVNRLSSILRGKLTLGGEKVGELDLASSQPYFLTTLFPSPTLREAVERGEFYPRINECMSFPCDFADRMVYGAFKQSVLAALYARPVNGVIYWKEPGNKCADILGAMDKTFPGIVEFLNRYRDKLGDTALPIALQRAESAVFIGQVLSNLQKKGVKAVPLHDAMLCQEDSFELVKKEISEALVKATGVEPLIRGWNH
jgi:hypothetical protein